MMSRMMFLLALVFVVQTEAAPLSAMHPYYGEQFYAHIRRGEANEDLRTTLRVIMRSYHRAVPGRFDEILPSCQGQGCYKHTAIGYERARLFLMGYFYLVKEGNQYGVRDVYCETVYNAGAGPNRIPNHQIVNVEHTWPQSRFSNRFDNEEQKSDLHHLYPTDSQMNATRGSFPFGEIVRDKGGPLKCPANRFGAAASGQLSYEPPDAHKGNVARSLFYFSTRYELKIAPEEEAALRAWNRMDPVDQQEMARNEEIFKAQGSRNPFVDYPDMADRIADF